MARFVNPFPQFFDDTGTPLSNGTVGFYAAGTGTLQAIYTDEGLTVPATNPAPLDADGRLTQNVFLSASQYRVILKSSTPTTIWDIDDFAVADTTGIQALVDQINALIATLNSEIQADNYIVNGGMAVDALDTASSAVSLTTAYQDTVSMMASAVLSNVSAGTAQCVINVQLDESGSTLAYLGVTATAAGTPALRYRAYSNDARNLSTKTFTFAMQVKHDVGAAVSYAIQFYTANAVDNFAAVTTTGISSTTSVASGAATEITATGTFADVDNGLEILVIATPGQAITGKNFYWSDMQLTLTSSILPFKPRLYEADYAMVLHRESFTGLKLDTSAMSAGTIVGRAIDDYATYSNLNSVILGDDSVPTAAEGTEIMSVSYTAASTTNILRFSIKASGLLPGGGEAAVMTLIADGTCVRTVSAGGAGEYGCLTIDHELTPGSVAAKTYAVRCGVTGGNFYINGSNAARRFGGTEKATMIVEEIAQ